LTVKILSDIIIKEVLKMVDRFSEVVLLLDFYGGLLTDKQKLIMSYHYEEDMSLSEISEQLEISRQAVHDILKRSGKTLMEYEKELGLIKRFLLQKEKLMKVRQLLDENAKDVNIKDAVEIINELIDM
jgi:uncharacterized protein